MFTVKTTNKNLHRGYVIYRDIVASSINEAYKKVMIGNKNNCSINDSLYAVDYSEITNENALELAVKHGYILTDLTTEYEPIHTVLGRK